MEIPDVWFDVIKPQKRIETLLTEKGLVTKELDVYELIVDRETRHCWIKVYGLQAQQVLGIKGLPSQVDKLFK